MTGPSVSARRLLGDLNQLASFGGRPDGGVDRVAGSAADLQARRWLAERLRSRGLVARADEVGNVFGHTPDVAGRRLLIGSHTDTVPAGGRLDGAYGVIAALEVLSTLHETGHPARDRLEIVSFWDEEGAQPESSGGLTGSTALCASADLSRISGFAELHIEQGSRMERDGLELCVVDGIVGVERRLITVRGEANHAGTTPFPLRRDAGRAVLRTAVAAQDVIRSVDAQAVGNVGSVTFDPGAPNVVPGGARMVLETRAPTDESLARCATGVLESARAVAAEEGCTVEHRRLSHMPAVHFDKDMRALLDKACRRTGRPIGSLYSYAGHDAGVLGRHVPTAMIFVPSSGGISHAPGEHTPDELLVQGAQVLLEAVIAYDRENG